jgi:hypothetical protein
MFLNCGIVCHNHFQNDPVLLLYGLNTLEEVQVLGILPVASANAILASEAYGAKSIISVNNLCCRLILAVLNHALRLGSSFNM